MNVLLMDEWWAKNDLFLIYLLSTEFPNLKIELFIFRLPIIVNHPPTNPLYTQSLNAHHAPPACSKPSSYCHCLPHPWSTSYPWSPLLIPSTVPAFTHTCWSIFSSTSPTTLVTPLLCSSSWIARCHRGCCFFHHGIDRWRCGFCCCGGPFETMSGAGCWASCCSCIGSSSRIAWLTNCRSSSTFTSSRSTTRTCLSTIGNKTHCICLISS